MDKFSVYNNAGGGGPPPPPPPRPSPIHFKHDGYLHSSFLTTSSKLEDAIRMEEFRTKDKESLIQLWTLLLAKIFPKWGKIEKAAPPETKGKKQKPTVTRLQKIDQQIEKGAYQLGRSVYAFTKPPLSIVQKCLSLAVNLCIKADEKAEKIVNSLIEPVTTAYTKTVSPLKRAAEKLSNALDKAATRLEKEGERVIATLMPPIKVFLERAELEISRAAQKVATPLRKVKTFIQRKIPPLPKPEFLRQTAERFLIKPFKVVATTIMTSPLVQGILKLAAPLKKGGQFLYQGGKNAYSTLSTLAKRGAAALAAFIEYRLRKISSLILRFLKILLAIVFRIYHFIKTIPKKISNGLYQAYLAIGQLTLWAKRLVS